LLIRPRQITLGQGTQNGIGEDILLRMYYVILNTTFIYFEMTFKTDYQNVVILTCVKYINNIDNVHCLC